MLIGVLALVLFFLLLIMVTLGAVLLARFILGGSSGSARIVAAAFGGPMTMVLPVFAVVLSEGFSRFDGELWAVLFLLLFVFCAIGWPVAHFATRRLDRLTRFNPQVFE
jgi:predicted permease